MRLLHDPFEFLERPLRFALRGVPQHARRDATQRPSRHRILVHVREASLAISVWVEVIDNFRPRVHWSFALPDHSLWLLGLHDFPLDVEVTARKLVALY